MLCYVCAHVRMVGMSVSTVARTRYACYIYIYMYARSVCTHVCMYFMFVRCVCISVLYACFVCVNVVYVCYVLILLRAFSCVCVSVRYVCILFLCVCYVYYLA